jgi:type IV secretory pathway TraG/TraD family ATPase VirD4
MRVLELPFNLRTAYRLLSDKTQLQEAITLLAQRPDAFDHLALVKHFEVFYLNLKSEGQSEGEIATIANFLAPYQHPAVADVFCSDQPDTLKMEEVDLGKKICLSMSEEYARERKYIFTILKLLFYQHGLRRLDLKARDERAFWGKNLLVLVGEEFQDVVTASDGGMSDYTVSAKIREANVSLLVLTQSQTSLLPPHKNKDQAHVLTLNLRNRMIYRAADEECAKRSADFIGKRKVQKRSRSTGHKGVQYTYQEIEEHKVKTWQLRKLPSFTPILLHAGKPGRYKRTALRPLTGREVTPLRDAQRQRTNQHV